MGAEPYHSRKFRTRVSPSQYGIIRRRQDDCFLRLVIRDVELQYVPHRRRIEEAPVARTI